MTPSGRFGIHYCTLPHRADPDRQIISCGEGRGSPPQGPSGRSERWFVDLREVPRVAPKSVIHDGPVGLFRNQIMIAAPSGPTQMIKILRQRKVVRRPPQGLSGRPETKSVAPSGCFGTDHDLRPRRALPVYVQCFRSLFLVLEFSL